MVIRTRVAFRGRERTSSVCGKQFIMHEGWIYKKCRGHELERLFCSWGCMRKFEKTRGTTIECRERIIQAIQDGLNDNEIAALLYEDRARVAYWRKKLEKENEEYERETGGQDGGETD